MEEVGSWCYAGETSWLIFFIFPLVLEHDATNSSLSLLHAHCSRAICGGVIVQTKLESCSFKCVNKAVDEVQRLTSKRVPFSSNPPVSAGKWKTWEGSRIHLYDLPLFDSACDTSKANKQAIQMKLWCGIMCYRNKLKRPSTAIVCHIGLHPLCGSRKIPIDFLWPSQSEESLGCVCPIICVGW